MTITTFDDPQFENTPHFDSVANMLNQFRSTAVTSSDVLQEGMIEMTTALNLYIRQQRDLLGVGIFSQEYPFLNRRLVSSPFITPAETQTFLNNNLITIGVEFTSSTLVALDSFFGPGCFTSAGMSSFCSLVPNIFAKYDALRDAFRQIESFADDLSSLIDGITTFSISNMLKSLQSQISNVIDAIIANIKATLSNFSAVFTKTSTYVHNLNSVHSKLINDYSSASTLVSDTSVAKIKESLRGSLAFMAGLFENLKIEEIEFIILRFCELISNLENFFTDSLRPLQDTVDNYQNAFVILKGSGLTRSARAVAAGAIRYTPYVNYEGGRAVDTIVGSDVSVGTGTTPVRQRSSKITVITSSEVDEVNRTMSYEAVTNGSSPYVVYAPGPNSASSGRLGWSNVQPMEKVMLMRLCKALGTKLHINSAWRSLATQARIRQGHEGTIPKSGYHQSGQAFDVSRVTINSQDEFINTARSIGFGGIGRYDTFIHIDSRYNNITFR